MKKRILWCAGFLLIVALIPLVSGIKGVEFPTIAEITNRPLHNENQESIKVTTDDEAKMNNNLTDEDKEIIVCKVMEHITEDAHTDTKKAMLAICKNNYTFLKNQGTTDIETNISKYSDSFLEELLTLYEESEYHISYNEQCVAIPLVPQNGGFTATSDEYSYVEAVASPWDTLSRSYIRGAVYPCGISIYGISYLCDNGYSWIEALKWYLPNFTITE